MFKTKKNFNGMRGLPITCSQIDDEELAVIEMGMDGMGQIQKLSTMIKPYIGVITNIGSSHLGKLRKCRKYTYSKNGNNSRHKKRRIFNFKC